MSGHAQNSFDEMLAGIAQSGLAAAIFTEHLPLPLAIDPHQEVSMHADDLEPYVETLRTKAEEFDHTCKRGEARPQLIIGGEADWLNRDPQWSAASVKAARAAGVDVVLGSVHMLDDWFHDDPSRLDVWESSDVDEVWEFYFTEWIKAVRSGLYDVMAHPDLPKKFGYLPADPRPYYVAAAEAAAAAGVLCEVSTGGLRKPCRELYPAQDFLELLASQGVRFTLGSDAHSVAEIGYGFDYAALQLRAAGVDVLHIPTGPIHTSPTITLPL